MASIAKARVACRESLPVSARIWTTAAGRSEALRQLDTKIGTEVFAVGFSGTTL